MGVTHLSGLSLNPTSERGMTAFEITAGTVQITAAVPITGNVDVTGSVTLTKNLVGNQNADFTDAGYNVSVNRLRFSNASVIGKRSILTGGSSTVSTNRVFTSSAIVLTPQINPLGYRTRAGCRIATISSGTNFKIMLNTPVGTAATGVVTWAIINTHT